MHGQWSDNIADKSADIHMDKCNKAADKCRQWSDNASDKCADICMDKCNDKAADKCTENGAITHQTNACAVDAFFRLVLL